MLKQTVVIMVQERRKVPLPGKPGMFTTEYGEFREQLVEVSIDVAGIAQALGALAVTRHSGKATGLHGRVIVKARR